jgi:hypothetical protein
MKYERIKLKDNHKRSLTATLTIIEELLIEVKDLMLSQHKTCCLEIKEDVDPAIKVQNVKAVEEALDIICKLVEKYNISTYTQSLKRIIDAKKAKMWEVLCDSKARKLKGFGEFPSHLIREFDNDIDELMSITNKINF